MSRLAASGSHGPVSPTYTTIINCWRQDWGLKNMNGPDIRPFYIRSVNRPNILGRYLVSFKIRPYIKFNLRLLIYGWFLFITLENFPPLYEKQLQKSLSPQPFSSGEKVSGQMQYYKIFFKYLILLISFFMMIFWSG